MPLTKPPPASTVRPKTSHKSLAWVLGLNRAGNCTGRLAAFSQRLPDAGPPGLHYHLIIENIYLSCPGERQLCHYAARTHTPFYIRMCGFVCVCALRSGFTLEKQGKSRKSPGKLSELGEPVEPSQQTAPPTNHNANPQSKQCQVTLARWLIGWVGCTQKNILNNRGFFEVDEVLGSLIIRLVHTTKM